MIVKSKFSMLSADGVAAPLHHVTFRRIWLASLLSNLGLLIQAVGAAWAMTQMTSSADKVALVQTALMLPVMLISIRPAPSPICMTAASWLWFRCRSRWRAQPP